jgi:hypothetical protein
MIFFSLACAASAFSIGTKLRFLVRNLRSRLTSELGRAHIKANFGIVPVGADGFAGALTKKASMINLQSLLDKSAFERTRSVLSGIIAFVEVWPLYPYRGEMQQSSLFSLAHWPVCRIFRWVRLVPCPVKSLLAATAVEGSG